MVVYILIGSNIYKQTLTVMGKLILIGEDDLRSLIAEAVNNAVDNITKKIAANAAVRFYNNEIFNPSRNRSRCVAHYDEPPSGCGSDTGGGCGSSSSRVSYSSGGCGSSGGGCGSSSPSGGCGGGYTSGGC